MRLTKDTAVNQMDKVRCMLIDANLTLKLWPYGAHVRVLIYDNLPHSALDSH
jgi:hypothetical protein